MFSVQQFCELLRELLKDENLTAIARKAGVTQGLLWRLVSKGNDSDMGIVKAGEVITAAGYRYADIIHKLEGELPESSVTEQVSIKVPRQLWEQICNDPTYSDEAGAVLVRYIHATHPDAGPSDPEGSNGV